MPLENGDVYIDEYDVKIDQQYRGGFSDGAQSNRITQHFIVRGMDPEHKKTIEIDHFQAYYSLILFLRRTQPAIVREKPEMQTRKFNCSKIDIPLEQSNYPVYFATVEWEYQPWRGRFGDDPVWSHSMIATTMTVQYPTYPQRHYVQTGETVMPWPGINWDNEKQAYEGVEIYKPEWKMTAKVVYGQRRVTPQFILALQSLVAKTNLYTFEGFPQGCVLYLGADIQQTSDVSNYILDTGEIALDDARGAYWNVTHQFIVAPDIEKFKINDIEVKLKRGHEYLWCTSATKANQQANAFKRLYADVAQVNVAPAYHAGDFSLLQIDIK